jgi:nucleoside-diphosphate-sugar epimerase
LKKEIILITGASGCVGQYIANWLIENSSSELFLWVRDPKKITSINLENPRIKVLVGDLRQSNKFKKETSEVNRVIHTATAWGDPKRAYDVNIKAFEELLGMLEKDKLEKIIYFSTASILNKKSDLMRESLSYGTEYIQTKYKCFERLKESSFAEKTFAVFPTLVFGGTLNKRSKYPVSYLTSGLKEINKWLWLARFLKLDSKFHFIHANDIAQICGFLIKNHKEENYKGFKKFVLGQNFISIDDAINILLKRNGMNRYFSIPLTKTIMKILLRVLPIQMTPWDSFSIKKYDFNHVPITNPEKLNLKSYARSLQDVLRLAKLPGCNIN